MELIYPTNTPISLAIEFKLGSELIPNSDIATIRHTVDGAFLAEVQAPSGITEYNYDFIHTTTGTEGESFDHIITTTSKVANKNFFERQSFTTIVCDYLTVTSQDVREHAGVTLAEVPDSYIQLMETYSSLSSMFTDAFNLERLTNKVKNRLFNRLCALEATIALVYRLPNLLAAREDTDNSTFVRLGNRDMSKLLDALNAERLALLRDLGDGLITGAYQPTIDRFVVGARTDIITGA